MKKEKIKLNNSFREAAEEIANARHEEIWEALEKIKKRTNEMESEEYEKKTEDKINKIIDKHENEKKEIRIIKRYLNRKLYDTKEKRYTTLIELTKLIEDKISIRVICNKTKEDITHKILMMILSYKETSDPSAAIEDLERLIRTSIGYMQFREG